MRSLYDVRLAGDGQDGGVAVAGDWRKAAGGGEVRAVGRAPVEQLGCGCSHKNQRKGWAWDWEVARVKFRNYILIYLR